MKVLQVHCGYLTPAGEDTVVHAEAALLRRYGHEVVEHHVRNPSNVLVAAATMAVAVHNQRAISSVVRALHALEPDVVHVHNTWFGLGNAILPALAKTGVPIVMTAHNYRYSCVSVDHYRDGICTACVGRAPLAGVRHACYKHSHALSLVAAADNVYHRARGTLVRSVDRIIAPSQFLANRLVEAGIPHDLVTVKPHFVEDRPDRSTPASASNRIVFAGRLVPGKGVEVLLSAWERFGGKEFELVIAGDGELMAELRESAPRGVRFLGWTDRNALLELVWTSRAMVFPSEWWEPFGMVLLEAMAAGLPILTSDVAAAKSIVEPDRRLLALAGDERDLALRLAFLSDDDLIESESARVVRRQREHFSADGNIASLVDIYRSVMR